jgi:hypothetical protein
MMTQKDLLSEGFLDSIRRGAAKTLGGAIGGVVGAAKQVAKDVAAADTSASIFNVAKQGAKGMVSGYKAEAERQLASTPELFVENELKSKYSSIFDPKSIKIIEKQQDSSVNLDLKDSINPKETKGNRFFVYFEARKYNETTGNSIEQIGGSALVRGVATVLRGSDRKFSLVELKDENGNAITTKDDSIIKNYDKSVAPYIGRITNPSSPTLDEYATVIKRAFNLSSRELKEITRDSGVVSVLDALKVITKKAPDDMLNQDDINLIKKVFKDNLIAEKTQINLLKQLNLLNDSYNKTYELSKY